MSLLRILALVLLAIAVLIVFGVLTGDYAKWFVSGVFVYVLDESISLPGWRTSVPR